MLKNLECQAKDAKHYESLQFMVLKRHFSICSLRKFRSNSSRCDNRGILQVNITYNQTLFRCIRFHRLLLVLFLYHLKLKASWLATDLELCQPKCKIQLRSVSREPEAKNCLFFSLINDFRLTAISNPNRGLPENK